MLPEKPRYCCPVKILSLLLLTENCFSADRPEQPRRPSAETSGDPAEFLIILQAPYFSAYNPHFHGSDMDFKFLVQIIRKFSKFVYTFEFLP